MTYEWVRAEHMGSKGVEEGDRPVVAVAGATGFIGSALAPVLNGSFRMVGLTRSDRKQIQNYDEVRPVELF